MRTLDVLDYAFRDYTSNKFKTIMSSLGIIIGVMAIVVMLTLGDGLYSGVSQQFGSMELDTMVVLPQTINMNGPQSAVVQKVPAKLTDRDVTIIMDTTGVIEVYPTITLAGTTVTSKGENRTMGVSAIVPQYFARRYASQVDKGRYLQQSDTYSVVLGSTVANGTFSKVIQTGSYITITNPYNGRSQDYVVVGIMKVRNASILVGDPNSAIYMTKAGFKALSDQDTYSYIGVRSDTVAGCGLHGNEREQCAGPAAPERGLLGVDAKNVRRPHHSGIRHDQVHARGHRRHIAGRGRHRHHERDDADRAGTDKGDRPHESYRGHDVGRSKGVHRRVGDTGAFQRHRRASS